MSNARCNATGREGRCWCLGTVLLFVFAMCLAAPSAHAQQPAEQQVVITYPREGDTVRGTVEITGSAMVPSFRFFKVEFGVGTNPSSWSVIGNLQYLPVTSGRLASWDTWLLPNGVYTLQLQAVKEDGNYEAFFVRGITVANTTPTARPATPTLTPTRRPTTEGAPTTVGTPDPPAGGGATWSAAKALSTNTRLSWFPAIVVDDDQRVHVFYPSGYADTSAEQGSRGDTAGIDVIMHTVLDDGAWLEPTDVISVGRGGYPARPRAAVGGTGDLLLSFRAWVQIRFARSRPEGAHDPQSWSAPRLVSGHNGAYYSDIAVDSAGVIHIVWAEVTQDAPGEESWLCPNCADVYYRHSADGGATWSAPVNLSRSPGGALKCQIEVDAEDVLHVIWEEGVDYTGQGLPMGLTYRRSLDGGVTWEPAYRILNGTLDSREATPTPTALPAHAQWFQPTVWLTSAGIPQQPAIAVDAVGASAVMVWRTTSDDHIYFQISYDGGGTWSAPEPVPGMAPRPLNDTPYDLYDLVTDSLGRAHLLVAGRLLDAESAPAQVVGLYHLVWDGKAWRRPVVIYEEPGMYPEWPQAAIQLGNRLHATWFVRSEVDRYVSDEGQYKVLHAQRVINAPTLAPAPGTVTTLTPTPQPEVTRTPAPDPTREPRPLPDSGKLDLDRLRSEEPQLMALAISLAPIGAIVMFLMVLRRRRRRP